MNLRRLWWSRYALLTIAAPALIVALAVRSPSLLRGLLLLRGSIAEPAPLRTDLGWLAWMSAMVVALGLAIFRILLLHGAARMAKSAGASDQVAAAELPGTEQQTGASEPSNAAAGDSEQSPRPRPYRLQWLWSRSSIGWPLTAVLAWLLVSVSFPLAAARETILDLLSADAPGGPVDLWQSPLCTIALQGIALGVAMAALCLFGLALLRTLLVGGRSAGSGLFFGEGLAYWLVGKIRPALASKSHVSFLKLPLHIPGFTDPGSRRLLPGHLQLLIALLASVGVYLVWYRRSMADQTWQPQGWSVGFYLLLLVYCIGAFVSFLAFWLDRFRIPVVLVVALYVIFTYGVSDSHRYFGLVAEQDTLALAERPPEGTGHVLLEALAGRPQKPEDYPDPPHLSELYGNSFHLPIWPDGRRTLVVVTASGGGIQAAAWTSRVLTSLEQSMPVLSESIGLVSAVSGGSVGALQYLAHRGPRENDRQGKRWMKPGSERLSQIHAQATASSLEAVGWGIAFPDFARRVYPFIRNKEIDRGWALEASWWNRMGRSPEDALWMKELRIRDLTQPTRDGLFPPVIFNATAVETGQRVLISPVRTTPAPGGAGQQPDYQAIDTPIDFLDFYGSAVEQRKAVNPRVSTAVRLSATFAYVTPVAMPMQFDAPQVRPGLRQRMDMHLCDGGYADNTGLVSAIRIIQDLIRKYQQDLADGTIDRPPFDHVVFLRIEPFPASLANIVRDNTGLRSDLFGPVTALTATRASTQAERADLELSLLMDVSTREFKTLQSRLDVQLQQRLSQLRQAAEENAAALAAESRLRQAIDRLVAMNASPPEDLDLQRQIGRIKTEIQRDADPTSEAARAIQQAIAQYDGVMQRSRSLTKPIDISTVLYRFDTRARPPASLAVAAADETAKDPAAAKASDDQSHRPPLSWRLAQTDLRAIEVAWKRYSAAESSTAVASASLEAAGEAEQPPWVPTNESLRAHAMSPNQLMRMANPAAAAAAAAAAAP